MPSNLPILCVFCAIIFVLPASVWGCCCCDCCCCCNNNQMMLDVNGTLVGMGTGGCGCCGCCDCCCCCNQMITTTMATLAIGSAQGIPAIMAFQRGKRHLPLPPHGLATPAPPAHPQGCANCVNGQCTGGKCANGKCEQQQGGQLLGQQQQQGGRRQQGHLAYRGHKLARVKRELAPPNPSTNCAEHCADGGTGMAQQHPNKFTKAPPRVGGRNHKQEQLKKQKRRKRQGRKDRR